MKTKLMFLATFLAAASVAAMNVSATEAVTQAPPGDAAAMSTPNEIRRNERVNRRGAGRIEIPKVAPTGATPIEIPKVAPTGATPIEIPGDGGLVIIPICDPDDPDCEQDQ